MGDRLNYSPEELASIVNLSASHTASLFRSAVGTSITD
jgi:AraC-like DNA-binding protein